MDASAFEDKDSRLAPDKAIDGKRGTRWSSGTAKPEKNTSTYLEVDLKATSKIGFLDIEFEERTVDVKPSNVKAFEIQYQAPGSSDGWQEGEDRREQRAAQATSPVFV